MIKTKSLKAYYPFEGNSDDASGNNNDLTNHGATQYTLQNKGAYKYGGDDGINFGNILSTYMAGSTAKFSWTFCFRTPSFTSQQFMITKYGVGKREFAINLMVTGLLVFTYISNTSTYDDYLDVYNDITDFTFAANTDYKIVITCDMTITTLADRFKMYVNGVEIDTTTTTSGTPTYIQTTTAEIAFGTREGYDTYPFTGLMWDVSFWNDVLTSSEVATMHPTGKPLEYKSTIAPFNNGNLISYWGCWDGDNNADDQKGSNDGTVVDAMLLEKGFGQYYYFDGVNDYLVPDTDFTFSTNCSLSFRINLGAITTFGYFFGDITNNVGIRYNNADSTLLCFASGATSSTFTKLTYNAPNRMVHFVINRTSSRNVNWYINGELVGNTDPGSTADILISSIGRRSSLNPYYAHIVMDSVAFYECNMTERDAKRLMLGLHPLGDC